MTSSPSLQNDAIADEQGDDPKLRLLADSEPNDAEAAPADWRQSLPPLLAAAARGGGPAWRLKRLRPVHLSVGVLASFAVCLAVCAPLVPDLVRELHPAAPASPLRRHQQSPAVTRLLSLAGHCVLPAPGNSSGGLRCVSAMPDCHELPALCRYRAGLLLCQVAAPVCLAVCLGLLSLATFVASRFNVQRRLLYTAFAFAGVGLVATVAFVACLHALVGELTSSSTVGGSSADRQLAYSADTAGARLAYAAIGLQAVLACQLACLPACLARVGAERADLLAKLLA